MKMNLGQIVSRIQCKECGYFIEIFPSQERTVCKKCNKIINLKIDIGIDSTKN